jgi:hypothetical protein
MRSETASDHGSSFATAQSSIASRAVEIGDRFHCTAASSRARASSFAASSPSLRARSAKIRARSGVLAARTSSISAGRLASTSPTIERSIGMKRWKSW